MILLLLSRLSNDFIIIIIPYFQWFYCYDYPICISNYCIIITILHIKSNPILYCFYYPEYPIIVLLFLSRISTFFSENKARYFSIIARKTIYFNIRRTIFKSTSDKLQNWGPIFRRFHGMPWPPNGSLNKSV